MELALHFLIGFVAAVAYALGLGLYHFYVRSTQAQAYADEFAVTFASIAGVLFALTARTIVSMVRRLLVLDWRMKAVGHWIEGVDHYRGPQLSISSVTYDLERDQLRIEGHTYEVDADPPKLFSEWHSLSTGFTTQNELYYIYILTNLVEEPPTVIGLAHMSFVDQPKKFVEGHGWFTDQVPSFRRVTYDFERIDETLCRKLITQKSIQTRRDREHFLKGYSLEKRSSIHNRRETANGKIHLLNEERNKQG